MLSMDPQAEQQQQYSRQDSAIIVPVVTFPLRGRFNPYWLFLVPLILLALAAFLLSLGALIASCLIPNNQALWDQLAQPEYKAARIIAIILYSISIAVSLFLMFMYIASLFNVLDSKFTPLFLDLITALLIVILIIISVLLIAAEASLPAAAFIAVVHKFALGIAGILGLSAVICLTAILLLSRFYEFCIGNYKNQKRQVLEAAELANKINGNPYDTNMNIV